MGWCSRQKYKLSKLKSGLDKIDTKDEVDDEKPDFDDIDKYLVPAGDLFRNLSQLKETGSHIDDL